MPRIITDKPSSGKPLNIYVPATINNGFVDTAWMELAEAPDFSIPSTNATGIVVDAADPDREIRSGELYFESPLILSNSTNTARWVQLEVVLSSSGAAFETGHFIPAGTGGGTSGRVFMCPRLSTSARLYDVATDTLSIPNGVFQSNAIAGSVQLNDNRIYLFPFGGAASPTARIYNPATDSFSTPNGTFSVVGGYTRAATLNDGRVFLVPWNETVARIYNPSTSTLTAAGGTYSLKYQVALTLASGKVLMLPFNAGRAALYDPSTDTKTEFGPALPERAFFGAVTLTDGRVFLVPHANPCGAIFDPAGSGSITNVDSTKWDLLGRQAYYNGRRMPDGRVYMNGAYSTQGRIWDPATDTSTLPSGQFTGDLDHAGLVSLADGKIYLIPYNAVAAKIYNPATDTLTTPAGVFPSAAERVPIAPQLSVPANGTIEVKLQGQRLLNPARPAAFEGQGGKLLIRAEVNNAIKVLGSAVENEASTHAPNTF